MTTNQLDSHPIVSGPSRPFTAALAVCIAALAAYAGPLQAATVDIPNGSFESPTVPPGFPAFPVVDSWQKSAQPPGVVLPGTITWDQLAGVFPNTPVGASDHIDNMDGSQAAYMFAIPGVTLFQDLSATYGVGLAQNLTVGVIGGGGGMPEGSSFLLDLYYRDGGNNMVTVGATPIIFTAAGFPGTTHFLDVQVNVPTVQPGDAWAGKPIGVQLLATGGTGVGYWDLDNARLVTVPEPSTLGLLALGLGGLVVARLRRWRA